MGSSVEGVIVRLAVPGDVESLEELLGKSVRRPPRDILIARKSEQTPLLGALSFSRIFSTWLGRSMGLNSMVVKDESVRTLLLDELAKLCIIWECSRIDCYTKDAKLATTLQSAGAADLTNAEGWHCFALSDLEGFTSISVK